MKESTLKRRVEREEEEEQRLKRTVPAKNQPAIKAVPKRERQESPHDVAERLGNLIETAARKKNSKELSHW